MIQICIVTKIFGYFMNVTLCCCQDYFSGKQMRKGIEGRGWSFSVPTFTQVAEAFHDLCRDVNQVLLTNPLLLQMTLKQKCQKE